MRRVFVHLLFIANSRLSSRTSSGRMSYHFPVSGRLQESGRIHETWRDVTQTFL